MYKSLALLSGLTVPLMDVMDRAASTTAAMAKSDARPPEIDQAKATAMTALGFYEKCGSAASTALEKKAIGHPFFAHQAVKKIPNFRDLPHGRLSRREGRTLNNVLPDQTIFA